MQKAFLNKIDERKKKLFRIEKRTKNSKIPLGPKILKSGPNNIIFKKLLCVTKKKYPFFSFFDLSFFEKKVMSMRTDKTLSNF